MRGAVVAMGAAVVGGCASAPAAVERAPCAAETRAWVERPVLSILPGHRESVVVISGGTLACIGVGDGVVWQGYPAFGEVVEVFGLRSRVRLTHGDAPPRQRRSGCGCGDGASRPSGGRRSLDGCSGCGTPSSAR